MKASLLIFAISFYCPVKDHNVKFLRSLTMVDE